MTTTNTVTKTTRGTVIRLIRKIGKDQWLVEPVAKGGTTMCAESAMDCFRKEQEAD